MGLGTKNNLKHLGMFHLTPETQDFFPGQSMSVNNIVETRMNGFQWNFQDKSDIRQETIWNIWGMLDPGSFFLFSGSVFGNNNTEKMGERIFNKFSVYV